MSIHFDKTYTTPADIVGILRERGLDVADSQRAEHYVRNIGYYRLSAYLYPLLQTPKEEHRFKNGSRFQDALNLYRFDKKLRLFLFNEIEKVEIALRSTLANTVAEETGKIFWMTDISMFADAEKFNRTMALIDKEMKSSKEEFILHFKEKYNNAYPPAWILVEILPLGVVTRIYENLADNALRKKIAARFFIAYTGIYFMDNGHYAYKKYLLPPRKGMEQGKSHNSEDCKEVIKTMGKSLRIAEPDFFRHLYPQMVCRHCFAA